MILQPRGGSEQQPFLGGGASFFKQFTAAAKRNVTGGVASRLGLCREIGQGRGVSGAGWEGERGYSSVVVELEQAREAKAGEVVGVGGQTNGEHAAKIFSNTGWKSRFLVNQLNLKLTNTHRHTQAHTHKHRSAHPNLVASMKPPTRKYKDNKGPASKRRRKKQEKKWLHSLHKRLAR